MKNIRIYHPEQFEAGQSFHLSKNASNHLIRVLRLKNNQTFTLFNGQGGEYSASLEISGKLAIAHVTTFTESLNESPLRIHLLQGISKGDRMDFAIQKSVELGVSEITPIICERTVVNLKDDRLRKKILHWQGIIISACEQSGRNTIPTINPACSFTNSIKKKTNSLNLILDPLSNNSFNTQKPINSSVSLLIGPEGGLTDNEINISKENSFIDVQLGPRILRTETAAIAALTTTQLLWGDLNT